MVKKGDIITLSNGEQATVVISDINRYKNILIVELKDCDVRVVDRQTKTLAKSQPHNKIANHNKIF